MPKFSVPLTLISLQEEGYHLLVQIKIFKKKHFAVLDTGASRTVFDKALIEQHVPDRTELTNEINAATLFSTTTTIQAIVPEIRIGRLKIEHYETVALDLQSVSETYAQFGHPEIKCILGGDILKKYEAVIDYRKLSLQLYV